ncbi:MAG: MFS transporter [Lentisphaeria bacterium]
MIIDGNLSEKQQQRSCLFYNRFNLLNGLSYMCLGETVIILLAVKLGSPDYVISTLGSMMYFGFILLPLGRIIAARVGAAQSQSFFWIARNLAAMLVALAVPVAMWWSLPWAILLLLFGAFLFYGFRAAGAVMTYALIGNITSNHTRGSFLASNTAYFYLASFVALLGISLVLSFSENAWVLMLVIFTGSIFGFFSTHFIRQIDESAILRQSARKPFLSEFYALIRTSSLRQQILSGFIINFSFIMIMSVSMLTLKRGYGVSDRQALIASLLQFSGSILFSNSVAKLARWIGPRRVMLAAYIAFCGICCLWIVCPAKLSWIYVGMIFFLIGAAYVAQINSILHYFLQTIPEARRIVASMIISVSTGVGSGIAGMLMSGVLLIAAGHWQGEAADLERYRWYFVVTTILLLPGILGIRKLAPLPDEKRSKTPPLPLPNR